MTHVEHRKACIEAMETAYWKRWEFPSEGEASVRDMLIAAFDALHGIATVNSTNRDSAVEALDSMSRDGRAMAPMNKLKKNMMDVS